MAHSNPPSKSRSRPLIVPKKPRNRYGLKSNQTKVGLNLLPEVSVLPHAAAGSATEKTRPTTSDEYYTRAFNNLPPEVSRSFIRTDGFRVLTLVDNRSCGVLFTWRS